MSKGHIRVITGSILIALQALAVLGNPDGGFFFAAEYLWYSVLYLLGFWGHGIVGFVLVKAGLNAKRTYEPVSIHVNGPQTGVFSWLRYPIAGLLTGFLVLGIREFLESFQLRLFLSSLTQLYHSLLCILAQGFMIVYLVGYVGKRPSHLFQAALGFSAAAYAYAIIPYAESLFASTMTAPASACLLLGSGIYAGLAVLLLRQRRKAAHIRLLGGIGSGLMLLGMILSLVMVRVKNALPTDLCLHLSIFVYTAAAPLTDTAINGGNEND